MLLMTGLSFLMTAAAFPGEPAPVPAAEVDLQVGYRVVDRQMAAVDADNQFVAGEAAIAWTSVAGVTSGFIEHVWYRDGVEVARHYLPVGSGRRWRTWSRHRLLEGSYELRVLGPDGSELASQKFEVLPLEGC